MKPHPSPPAPQSSTAALRALALQTHLELMELLQHPLYRHVRHQMTHADIFKYIMEVIDQVNIEQGVVR